MKTIGYFEKTEFLKNWEEAEIDMKLGQNCNVS